MLRCRLVSLVILAVSPTTSDMNIYSGYLESHGSTSDALMAISTSGSSANVIEAVKAAK